LFWRKVSEKTYFVCPLQQLTDAHLGFDAEKAAWASQESLKYAKIEELEREIVNLTEELEKVQDLRSFMKKDNMR